MSDEEIQSALVDQFVLRACRLIGMMDNKPFSLHLKCPLCLHRSMSGMRGFRFAYMFLTPCGATDMRSSDIPVRGVLLALSAVSAVRVGTVRSHCPTHPTLLCEVLRSTRISRQKCPVFLEEKAIQERRAKDGLSFMGCPLVGTQSFATAVRALSTPQLRPLLQGTAASR
jgi:hypothetical protein